MCTCAACALSFNLRQGVCSREGGGTRNLEEVATGEAGEAGAHKQLTVEDDAQESSGKKEEGRGEKRVQRKTPAKIASVRYKLQDIFFPLKAKLFIWETILHGKRNGNLTGRLDSFDPCEPRTCYCQSEMCRSAGGSCVTRSKRQADGWPQRMKMAPKGEIGTVQQPPPPPPSSALLATSFIPLKDE